ncbi:hypothetical protein BUALT_Bualt18G0027200 [Buddleja alternifolia]|uniref:GPI-anchored protein LLG1-like domain-containing protein n=1 Tax=Buddleja alternifolia TaxID=168488 RepID=A0AAV6WBE6_9LAMI|nr:hypothetical protein BUALT_Bualt18G0027200 [Buddleja alternifolia]
MGSKRSFYLFLFFLVVGFASSSYISNEVLETHGSVGRTLLQQKTSCTLDFEHMNYTVITSKCKGPHFTSQRCCPPFKELLCPEDVRDKFNDLNSNCAAEFYSYVNLYGKYPPGLFTSLCKETQEGLDCKAYDAAAQPPNPNGALHPSSALVITLFAVGMLIFHILI